MNLDGKRILIVEDDNFVADMFIRKLQSENAICTHAVNGKDALDKLKEMSYDLDMIITDVMMAGMDGYELVKQIKTIDELKSIPIVVLTNRTSLTEENSKILDLDINALYTKSNTNLSDLVQNLANIFENKELQINKDLLEFDTK